MKKIILGIAIVIIFSILTVTFYFVTKNETTGILVFIDDQTLYEYNVFSCHEFYYRELCLLKKGGLSYINWENIGDTDTGWQLFFAGEPDN